MQQADTLDMTGREAPLVLGRYRLVRRLGSGGFGTVWEANDERLERPVAVKRIPLDGEDNPRAEREALAAARLGHPAIVGLYEAARDEEAWWLVSELVRGRTLSDLEREGALSDLDVVRIGVALCDALAHAHARGVVHRDVKPGNVIVADDGTTKLTDFGIARLQDSGALTRTGDVVGTIAYMAPEQAEGRRVTEAADLYALALVLFEGFSGTNPVRAEGAGATARRVGMRLPELGRLRPDLPPDLCDAIDLALEPAPEGRGTLHELRAALEAAESQVDDEPGVVGEGPLEALTERTRAWRDALAHRDPPADPAPADEHRLAPALEAPPPRWRRARTTAPGRVVAGVASAALALWLCESLPVDLTLGGAFAAPQTAAVAAGAGLATALLPRLGWLAALAALLVLLGPDRTTLAVLAAALPVPLLLLRHGPTWSVPAAAPALGAIALAGAFPAVAGQARTPLARASLGALGAWWLAIAGVVTDARPDLGVLTAPGTLALAGMWAAAAALLPLVVRGRRAAVDAAGAAAWAAALAAATPAVAEAVGAPALPGSGPAAALGAGMALVAAAWRRGEST